VSATGWAVLGIVITLVAALITCFVTRYYGVSKKQQQRNIEENPIKCE